MSDPQEPETTGESGPPPEMEAEPYESDDDPGPTVDAARADAPPASDDARAWCMAAHLTALITLGFAPTLTHFLGPLAIYLFKRDEDEEVEYHAAESLNFQVNMLVWQFLAGVLVCVGIGLVLLPILVVANVVLVVMASVDAAAGKRFRYPWIVRILG